jgi:hypothetical protein
MMTGFQIGIGEKYSNQTLGASSLLRLAQIDLSLIDPSLQLTPSHRASDRIMHAIKVARSKPTGLSYDSVSCYMDVESENRWQGINDGYVDLGAAYIHASLHPLDTCGYTSSNKPCHYQISDRDSRHPHIGRPTYGS